jgi:hypothetical protein
MQRLLSLLYALLILLVYYVLIPIGYIVIVVEMFRFGWNLGHPLDTFPLELSVGIGLGIILSKLLICTSNLSMRCQALVVPIGQFVADIGYIFSIGNVAFGIGLVKYNIILGVLWAFFGGCCWFFCNYEVNVVKQKNIEAMQEIMQAQDNDNDSNGGTGNV